MNLFILCGPSGSGKSTFANKLNQYTNISTISTDNIREEICGDASDQSKNNKIFEIAYKRISEELSNNKDVIFDATNLNPKDRKRAIEIGKEYGAKIIAYVFQPTFQECVDRQKLRDRKVPTEVIERQFRKCVMPTKEEGFDCIVIVK